MFARLILALLFAAFALPALANGPCHDAPFAARTMAMAPADHHRPARDDHATVPHVCIGCIPLAGLATPVLVAPPVTAPVPRRIVAAAFDPASGARPTLRPPRRTA